MRKMIPHPITSLVLLFGFLLSSRALAGDLAVDGNLNVASNATIQGTLISSNGVVIPESQLLVGTNAAASNVVAHFEGDVTLAGVNNLMPNQIFINSNSVLTGKLGDGRYILQSGGVASSLTATGNTLMGASNSATTINGELIMGNFQTDTFGLIHSASDNNRLVLDGGGGSSGLNGGILELGGRFSNRDTALSTISNRYIVLDGKFNFALGTKLLGNVYADSNITVAGMLTVSNGAMVYGNTTLGTNLVVNHRIGIGTNSPVAPLHIFKSGLSDVGQIQLDEPVAPNGSTSVGPHIYFKSGGASRGFIGFFDASQHGNGADLNIKTRSGGSIQLGSSSSGFTTATVVLDPAGLLTVHSNLLVNINMTSLGTNSVMPNQTLVNSNSVLTAKLGDARYPLKSTIASGPIGASPSATGTNSVAIGYNAVASGNYSFAAGFQAQATADNSFAIGRGAVASGANAVALGWNTVSSGTNASFAMGGNAKATQYYAVAFGQDTLASGGHAFAAGAGSVASGYRSAAMNYYTTASGDGSSAMGRGTVASGVAQLAIGQYNIIATNSAFVIGNGAGVTNVASIRSDAFRVNFQGDTWMAGGVLANSTSWFNGNVGIGVATNVTPSAKLHVNGTSLFESNLVATANVGIGTNSPQAKLHVNGTARFEQAVYIVPQGDLSMGAFTNSPSQ